MQVDVANVSNLDGKDNGDGNISSSGSRHSGEDDDEEDTKSLLHNTSVDSLCDLDEENDKTGFADINIELEVNKEDE
eukprot:g9440.t1